MRSGLTIRLLQLDEIKQTEFQLAQYARNCSLHWSSCLKAALQSQSQSHGHAALQIREAAFANGLRFTLLISNVSGFTFARNTFSGS